MPPPTLPRIAERRRAAVHRYGSAGCSGGCSHKGGGAAAQDIGAPPRTALAERISRASLGGTPLPPSARASLEQRLGADLSGVRVHTGATTAPLVAELGARAVTVGSDIHFGRGEFRPDQPQGRRLLAHEVAHVLQPRGDGGPQGAPTTTSQPSDPAEREAEKVADAVTAGDERPTAAASAPPAPAPPGAVTTGVELPPWLAPQMLPGAPLGVAGGGLDAVCLAMRLAGQLPAQKGVGWKGHPRPTRPTPCNSYPGAPYQDDPRLVSGAKCRGVCGADCARNCKPEPDRYGCATNPDGRSHSICLHRGVQTCGSHDGCRHHDACYDWCADHGSGSVADSCHRWCDLGCLCDYGVQQCATWALGYGPFDSTMTFYDESISPTYGPFPGACPAVAPMIALDALRFLSLGSAEKTMEALADAPPVERLHLLTSPFAVAELQALVGGGLWPTAQRILAGQASVSVPALDEATVYLTARRILQHDYLAALRRVLDTLFERGQLDRALAAWWHVARSDKGEGLTQFDWTVDPVTDARRVTTAARVEIYDPAFLDAGWLFSTIMHEYVHVLQVWNGASAREFDKEGQQRPEFVARDEVEAYLWEIEHAVGSGVVENPAQLADVARRLTRHYNAMTAPLQLQYRARYAAAQQRAVQVAFGVRPQSVGDARRTLQTTSREITELLSSRPGHEADVDAKITELRRRRQEAMITVALVDNPVLQVVQPGDPGSYRVPTRDASGRVEYLYGGISVGWHLAATSTSAYTLGPALGAGGKMAIAGTAIQGRVHPFPPDIDFDEHIHVVAATAEDAAYEAADRIIAGIRRVSGGPKPGRTDLEFRHLVSFPAVRGSGRSVSMTLGQVLRPDAVDRLAAAIKDHNGGNLNTFWRGFLADGRFTDITRVIYVSASDPGGRPLLRLAGSQDFNLAYLDDPGVIPTTELGKFAQDMCCDARARAAKGAWLKAAKRAYNYFSTIGDLDHMAALEPAFLGSAAELETHATVIEAMSYVLSTFDNRRREPQTRILTVEEARDQLERVARRLDQEMPGTAAALRSVAARLRARDARGNLRKSDELAERLDVVEGAIRRRVSLSVESQVRPVIEHTLPAACPACRLR